MWCVSLLQKSQSKQDQFSSPSRQRIDSMSEWLYYWWYVWSVWVILQLLLTNANQLTTSQELSLVCNNLQHVWSSFCFNSVPLYVCLACGKVRGQGGHLSDLLGTQLGQQAVFAMSHKTRQSNKQLTIYDSYFSTLFLMQILCGYILSSIRKL